MFRTRLVTDLDAINSAQFFVFEFGIVRVQEPNPIEFIVNQAKSKFVFADHKSERNRTWVYLSSGVAEIENRKTVLSIAESEGYGEFLGFYNIDPISKLPNFRPAESLLPSEAIDKLKKGVKSVETGAWRSPIG